MKNPCNLLDRHAKQWGLRPDIQLSTTILVFRSWQQDLRLENGQGTDAKLCQHIFATLWWIFTPLVKRLYNFSSVSGTMNLLQPILMMGDRNLKPCLQRFGTVLTWDSELPKRVPSSSERGNSLQVHIFEEFSKRNGTWNEPLAVQWLFQRG